MTANELANLLEVDSWYKLVTREEIAAMLRQQQAEIEALKTENKALYNLVAEQDKKIIDLAFKLAYAERSNEIVLEVNTRSRP